MGCCSCCWIVNKLSVDEGLGQQANFDRTARGSSCDGCCAQRCRRPGRNSDGSAPPQAAAGRRVLGSAGSAGNSGNRVAHAHLSRLISAAGAALSPLPGSADASSISSSAPERDHRQQGNPRVSKPLPRRFASSTAGVARQNPRLLSLLAGMLSFNPDERLTPLQALAHPFFGEALPFTDLPQATTAAAAEHLRKAPAVAPAATSRVKERGHGSSAAAPAQHGHRQSVATPAAGATCAPRSPVLARRSSSSHRQRESSPRPRCNGGGGGGGVDTARHESSSMEVIRPSGGNKQSSVVPGAAGATAVRLSLPSRPGAAASSDVNGTPDPSCEVDSTSGSSNASREMDPTAQLRRLAEMAGAMVSKGSNRYGRGRENSGTGTGSGGGGGGSDSSSTAPPPSPRRNPFLNAELLARLKREDPPADSRKPGVSGAQLGQHQQQPRQHHGSSKIPQASQRRPNPFLTPATLAILNPDLWRRKEAGEAVAATPAPVDGVAAAGVEGAQVAVARLGWGVRRTTTSTAAAEVTAPTPVGRKSPTERDKHSPSPTRAAATKSVATAQPRQLKQGVEKKRGKRERQDSASCEKREKREPGTPSTAKRKRTRRQPRAADSNGRGASPSRAREGGRMTTPRRAAVAAGVAILRLRDDDESSDGSLTL